jgi:hypothetical protein
LYPTEINVAVNLTDIVSGTTHVMLNKTAAFKNCNLRDAFTYLYTHEVSTHWSAIAFASSPTLDDVGLYCFA